MATAAAAAATAATATALPVAVGTAAPATVVAAVDSGSDVQTRLVGMLGAISRGRIGQFHQQEVCSGLQCCAHGRCVGGRFILPLNRTSAAIEVNAQPTRHSGGLLRVMLLDDADEILLQVKQMLQ